MAPWRSGRLAVLAQRVCAALGSRCAALATAASIPPSDSTIELARLEGARLAIRTVRHNVANKLAVVVGHGELLADDPRLPPDLQAQASRMVTSAMEAAEVVQRLDENLVRVQLDGEVEGPRLVDVERSTTP